MKKNIFSIVMSTMCATLSLGMGINLLILAEVGWNNGFIAGVLLLLVAVTLAALVRVSISELLSAIRIAEIDAGLKQIHNLQKIYDQSNA